MHCTRYSNQTSEVYVIPTNSICRIILKPPTSQNDLDTRFEENFKFLSLALCTYFCETAPTFVVSATSPTQFYSPQEQPSFCQSILMYPRGLVHNATTVPRHSSLHDSSQSLVCPHCQTAMDYVEDHSSVCKSAFDVAHRHNIVRSVFAFEAFRHAGPSAQLEASPLVSETNLRPVNVLVQPSAPRPQAPSRASLLRMT